MLFSNSFAKTAIRAQALGVILVVQAIGVNAQVPALAKPTWTVSLSAQGYHRYSSLAKTYTKVGDVAATRDTVAVTLCGLVHRRPAGGWDGPWEVYLVIYDAKTGRFLSKKGPWKSDSDCRLATTSSGKLLLILGAEEEPKTFPVPELLLFSAQGEEVKHVKLEGSKKVPRPKSKGLFLSSSGHTILEVSTWSDEQMYRVMDMDSLDARLEWTELKEGKELRIVSISDEWMLARTSNFSYAVRSFRGDWKTLPDVQAKLQARPVFDSSSYSGRFVSKDTIAGKVHETNQEFVWPVFQTDGTLQKEYVAPRLPNHNGYSSAVAISSQDDVYIGLRLQNENPFTYWWDHTMDMSPLGAAYFLYFWTRESTAALARIKVGENSRAASFFPPGMAQVAIVDGETLKVFALPSPPPTY